MKNELSVWTFPYRKTYYLTHPWKWFYDLYWNIRNFIHRGKYGFAYIDAWNFGYWWPKVGAEALKYIAEHGSGYPGVEPWDTHEKWKAHLLRTYEQLNWCAKSFDDIDKNEYSEAMDEIYKRCHREKDNDDGTVSTWLEMTPEDKEIRDKYFEKIKEDQEKADKRRIEIFTQIGQNISRYWD